MKVCSFPFEYFYLDTCDGNVWLCPWMKREYSIIGNLYETPPLDLWQGEKAQALRKALGSGDISLCRPEACPFIQNHSLPDLEGEALEKFCITPDTPRSINLAHDFLCNLYCETCRKAKFRPRPGYKEKVLTINRLIAPLLDKAARLSLSGHGDPFASPYMMDLLHTLRPTDPAFHITLETNGVYFDPRHWEKIAHLAASQIELIITVNSYDKFTYLHISRGGKYEKLMDNLDFAARLRREGFIKTLRLTMVIQDKNFREIPSFIQTSLERYDCDEVVLRPVYQWGSMPEDVYWFKDVLNPMHPYHQEYLEILDHPALADPRVYHFGGRSLHKARPFPGHSTPTAAPHSGTHSCEA